MNKNEQRLFFWNTAAKGGSFIALVLILGLVLGYLSGEKGNAIVNNISIFVAFVGGGYLFGKRFSRGYGNDAITYTKALGFVLTTILLSGVLYGIATFIMCNYVDPVFYRTIYENGLKSSGLSKDMLSTMESSYEIYTGNPLITVVSSVFNMAIFGLFPSLIIASYIKRDAIKN